MRNRGKDMKYVVILGDGMADEPIESLGNKTILQAADTPFLDMLSKKSFEKITVKSICENADISRITFYSHYDDKYDLVSDI